MTNQINEEFESFEVQGFTPYAQIPKWVLRSGKKLSHGAKALYGVIMTYADNETRAAFPGKEKLAEDMGASVRSIFNYMKELEDFGALKVTRRRNKKTGNYYANHYTLVFNDPSATECRRPSEEECPRSKPTILNIDPPSFTSEDESSDQRKEFHDHASAIPTTDHLTSNPGNLTAKQRYELRAQLRRVGQTIQAGHKFYSEKTQDEWWHFIGMMEDAFKYDFDNTSMADLLHNQKWTVTAKVADPYEAGKELNKLIATSYAT